MKRFILEHFKRMERDLVNGYNLLTSGRFWRLWLTVVAVLIAAAAIWTFIFNQFLRTN